MAIVIVEGKRPMPGMKCDCPQCGALDTPCPAAKDYEEAMRLLEPGRLYSADGREIPTTLVERARWVGACLEAEAKGHDDARERCKQLAAELSMLRGVDCAEEQAAGNGPCGVCLSCLRSRSRPAKSNK